jgi:hypothetical protein
MKHIGKMKNNSARVVVAYRTLPGEPNNCLVVGTQGLGDSYHDFLMTLVETDSAQQANELAEVLATRRFADGSVMLGYLHANGHLKKVPTANVLMTPDTQTSIPLDQLNQIIADQKGVSIDQLAVNDGSEVEETKAAKKTDKKKSDGLDATPAMSAADMRSRADALYKEAAQLRKEADLIDPPKSKVAKSKKETASAE